MGKIYDERWYTQLVTLIKNMSDDAEWIQGSMHIESDEYDRFLDNEIENPLFSYGGSSSVSARPPMDTNVFEHFLQSIATEEKNDIVRALYVKKVENQIARIHMLNASLAQNDKEFYRLSCLLHGKPKKKYFAYVAKQVNSLCKQAMVDSPAEAKRLKKIFSKIDVSAVDISAGILPPLVQTGKIITSTKEVVVLFQEALDQYNITDWKLVVDTHGTRSRFSVSADKKTIYIPNEVRLAARPKPFTDVELEAVAAHEIGVHVRRADRGIKSNLQLLQRGLDSYLLGEEGVASYVQQQCEGATEFYGFDRYMAAGLAVGLDGTKRDFRAVFSVMVDYYTMQAALGGERAKVNPVRAAWEVCVRIFRGTTGQTAGFIYTKDIVYMEGNIGIWHLLSEKPHVYPQLFLGKYNPLLPRHVKALQELEILTDW